jgi:manganese transport protein
MKITQKIQFFLPGIFLLGFNIGTGSVTAMAKAGATYNMSLLWTVFLSCLITYFMIVMYGRFTLITGDTALFAFKKYLHPGVGLFFVVALSVNVCGSIIGVMGIIADICYEWSKGIIADGISPVHIALFFILIVYLIFWNGRIQFFQRALAVIVAIMSASFILNFFILMPPPIEILKGMIPTIPKVMTDQHQGPFLVIASMVGTTVFSGLFIIRTTLVKEAGWTINDLRHERRDAMFSAFMMFLISATIMSAAAGTLYLKGVGLSKASQMVQLLEPLAGRFAVTIFVTGIVAAGVSSQFPNVLLLPWLLCDYNQSSRDMTQPKYRIIVFIISLLGLIVPLFKAPPVIVMIASQAFGAVILPVTVLCILYLSNQKRVMGKYTNSWSNNLLLVFILLFALYMSINGIKGLLGTIF